MSSLGYSDRYNLNSAFLTQGFENDPRLPHIYAASQINNLRSPISTQKWAQIASVSQSIGEDDSPTFAGLTLSSSTAPQLTVQYDGTNKTEFSTASGGELTITPSGGSCTIDSASTDLTGTLGFSSGTTVNEFSTDGTLAGDSDDAIPTEKAVKTYVDTQVASKDTFIELTDTPSGYTTANALYTANATPDGVIETEVALTEAANEFIFTKGSANIDVTAACNVDQDLSTTANVNHGTLALTSTTTPQFYVKYDGSNYGFLSCGSGGTLSMNSTNNKIALQAETVVGYNSGGNGSCFVATDETSVGSYSNANGAFQSISDSDGVGNTPVGSSYTYYSAGVPPVMRLRRGKGTMASPTVVDGTEALGEVEGYGYNGTDFGKGGRVRFLANGTWSGTSYPTSLSIDLAAADSTSTTQRLYMGSDGANTMPGNLTIENTVVPQLTLKNSAGKECTFNINSSGYCTVVPTGGLFYVSGNEYISGTLGMSTGTTVNEFSIDGTLAGNSDDAIPTEKAVKTYVDTSVAAKDSFLELSDTPGSYTASNTVYTTNGTTDGVIETGVVLTEAANEFVFTKGSADIDVTASCDIDQDLSTLASVAHKDLALTSEEGAQLDLKYDGSNNTTFQTSSAGNLTIVPSGPSCVLNATLALETGTAISKFSTDGGLSGNSDDYLVSEKAIKTYVDGQISAHNQFTELSDTPSTFTTANGVYTVNATTDGVIETGVALTEAADEFTFTKGTSNIHVTSACNVDQNLSTTADINHGTLALISTSTPQLSVKYDGDNYGTITAGSTGNLILNSTNNTIALQAENVIGYNSGGNGSCFVATDETSISSYSNANGAFQHISDSAGTGSTAVGFSSTYCSASVGPSTRFKRAKGTIAAPTALDTNQLIGGTECYGYGATDYGLGGAVYLKSDGSWTDASFPTKFLVQLVPSGSTALSNVFTISNAGAAVFSGNVTLASGTSANEFSIDGTLAGNSDDAIPTEKAVKTYVDTLLPAYVSSTVSSPVGSNPWYDDLDIGYGYQITGNSVTLTLDEYFATSSGSGSGTVLTGVISAITPPVDVYTYIIVLDDGTEKTGILKVSTAGQISIDVAPIGTNFSLGASGNTGFYGCSISYNLNIGSSAPS